MKATEDMSDNLSKKHAGIATRPIMNLHEHVFGWASKVFPEDLVSHEKTRRFNLGLWKLLKISLRYTLASHICSFVICIPFVLVMICFHFVPFSQEMKPPENYYYTPWAVGFQYGCSNVTLTFLAPLFLVSFIFGFKRSRIFWFVLLPLGIACVPGEALLGYYNYQFWAQRLQGYSFYVATLVVFFLSGVWVACHFRVSRWIIWDFFKVAGTITLGIGIFNNCILPAFGIGFAPNVGGIALTPFTPDSNTAKWKTLVFRIFGVPAFMRLTFFLMRCAAIVSKVAAQEKSHVYWCWGHAMNNIYLRLITRPIMNLHEHVFGWASKVFPEDLVSHEKTRRFNLGLWKLLKISLRYTLASHICSFVICIPFVLVMICFHFVPFSQEMTPPENYYYTPWAVGFQYGCNNVTLTFLAPLFLVSFIFGFKRSRIFWFVLLPLGIACVPGEALLGYYNYQFWAQRLQLYSFYVATLVVFFLSGVWIACHFRVSRWIIWDFFKVGGTTTVGIWIFNNCILPAFGIGFAPNVGGIALTPFTPDSNTAKWKTLVFRIFGVPAFMQLTLFLMRRAAIVSKVAAQEKSHVYWCWGHAMNNIYLRLIAFELDTMEILISSSADMLFQVFLTLLIVAPIKRALQRVFTCCMCCTRYSCKDEENGERKSLIEDSDEEIAKDYGTSSSSGIKNCEQRSCKISEEEDNTVYLSHKAKKRSSSKDSDFENTCKGHIISHMCHNPCEKDVQTNNNMLPKTCDDEYMSTGSNEKLSHHDNIQQMKYEQSLSSGETGLNNCKIRENTFDETSHASEGKSSPLATNSLVRNCASKRIYPHGNCVADSCTQHNTGTGPNTLEVITARTRHSHVEAAINSDEVDSLSRHLTNPAGGESTLSEHDLTKNGNNDDGTISNRKKTIIEIFFHSNTISKMVGIVGSVVIYTLMYRHRYVYDIGYVNEPDGVDTPIQLTQILACICIPLVFEVISDIISSIIMIKCGWFSVIPVWANHGFRITCVVGVSFLVMLPSILHGFIALPMEDSCRTLDVCTCQTIFKWLVDKCNGTNSTAM